MYTKDFFDRIKDLIGQIEETQYETLQTVAKRCADAIEAERWVHLFGTGHSSIPAYEAFPRIGSYVGFHPLLELNLSISGQVVGGMAQRQASFLERVEGYAEAIMANYKFSSKDVIILFSHSGLNELTVEMALIAKEKGMCVVGVTSLNHSQNYEARHSCGKRLYEVVDYVIDTCAPEGDAVIQIEGLTYSVAGSSTILACTITNALVAQIAAELVERSYIPTIWPSHNIGPSCEEDGEVIVQEERVYAEYWERLSKS